MYKIPYYLKISGTSTYVSCIREIHPRLVPSSGLEIESDHGGMVIVTEPRLKENSGKF